MINKKLRRQSGEYIKYYYPNHPNSDKQGYILEHRLTMEHYLGRYLTSKEIVHHIDGDKHNNKITNLAICRYNGEHSNIHNRMNLLVYGLIKTGLVKYNKKTKDFDLNIDIFL